MNWKNWYNKDSYHIHAKTPDLIIGSPQNDYRLHSSSEYGHNSLLDVLDDRRPKIG